MELLQDTNIWVLFSFILFLFILWRYGKPAFLNLLDTRIASIRDEIATAESLRIEAQELLAQYQRKQRDAQKEADAILKRAKSHAASITKQAEADLKDISARREQQLKERLARMENNAKREIQTYAAELAVQATTQIIIQNMDKKTNENLIDQSIKTLSKKAA